MPSCRKSRQHRRQDQDGPGTLYGTVKRLIESKLIEESDERPDAQLDDERRRYYRLTGVGEQVVRAEPGATRHCGRCAREEADWQAALISLPGGCP